MEKIEKLRTLARNTPLTFATWFTAFLGIVIIRFFFEEYSNYLPQTFGLVNLPFLVHGTTFYLTTIMFLMLILMFFGKIDFKEVLVVSLFGLPIILIPPIIDLVSGGVGVHTITYLFASWYELFYRFITFFGGHTTLGATLGIQIEVALGVLFCFGYVYIATRNWSRALGAAIVFYVVIFILFATPSIVSMSLLPGGNEAATSTILSISSSKIILNNLNPNFSAIDRALLDLGFDKMMLGINLLAGLVAMMLLFMLGIKNKFIAVIKNIRLTRLFHFFLLFLFGSSLVNTSWFTNWLDIQGYLLALISLTAAWMFSVCQNDIYDEKIDSISSSDRPLISQKLSPGDLQTASGIFLVITILSAYAAGHYTLFFMTFFLFMYFIYSNPPLRLKRFLFANSLLVALACLSVIMAGFFLISPNKNIVAFPFGLVIAILIFFTAVSNVKDIKDATGDSVNNIRTLPVLLGLEKSKKLIAGTICFFFLVTPWYFGFKILIAPSIIASIMTWYFINQKNYKEWRAFVVYMAYLVLIIAVFIWS